MFIAVKTQSLIFRGKKGENDESKFLFLRRKSPN